MSGISNDYIPISNRPVLRIYAPFLLGFFLLFVLITAFFLVPKINQAFEKKHNEDVTQQMAIESELLVRFVENLRWGLQDLASFPVLINAAMLSSADNQGLLDFVDNAVLDGNKSKLVLQDISGEIVLRNSAELKGHYGADSAWLKPLLDGELDFYFQLLEQQEELFLFSISVPIKYGDNVEGILSAEITRPLSRVFSERSLRDKVAFRLTQSAVTVQTDKRHIELPREYSFALDALDLRFIYIVDHAPLIAEEYKLRNIILGILLAGLIAAFIFFAVLVYYYHSTDDEQSGAARHSLFSLSYAIPLMLAVMGVAASITAYFTVKNLQDRQQQQHFQAELKEQIQLIRQDIRSNLTVLNPLKGFYNASKHVDRQEFKQFAKSVMGPNSNIQALEWIPKVAGLAGGSGDTRQAFETQARADGFKDFTFTERNTAGNIVSAQQRPVYFPVYYVEPMSGNEAAFGFDLASSAPRIAALNKARDSGVPVATEPITLVQESSEQTGLLVFNPIYKGAADYPSLTQRREFLQGFVLLVLRVEDLIRHSLGEAAKQHFISVVDITDSNKSDVMFNTLPDTAIENRLIAAEEVLIVAGRSWRLTLVPKGHADNIQASWVPLVMLTVGLLFTDLISFILIQLTRRRHWVEDLVARRTAELQENKTFQELMLSSIPDLIFVKDKEFRLVNANPAFLKLYPEPIRDKVIGTTTVETYDEAQADEFLKHDREAFATGQSENYETISFPNGDVHTLFTKKVRFENSVGEPFILGIARDVTEREDLVCQLTRSNEELDEFAYIASHDLKEPLRGIYNHASIFQRNVADQLDEDGSRRVNRIMELTRYMETLVSDLLYFSRMGRTDIAMQATDLDVLVREIITTIPMAEEPDVEVRISETLPTVLCDKVRIGETYRNLIVNGLKYHDGGRKVIEVGTVEQNVEGKIRPVFYVKDNGIGIDVEFHQEIFRIFKRLHKKTAYGGGTGSGLTFVKKIIDRHGGDIWVKSQKGQGSTFYFTLPDKEGSMKPTEECAHE